MKFSYLVIVVAVLWVSVVKAHSEPVSKGLHKVNLSGIVLDTAKTGEHIVWLDVLWLNDTITLAMQKKDLQIDFSEFRSTDKDSAFWTQKKKQEEYVKFIKTSAQNCYSYALERYFQNDSVYAQDIFSKYSSTDRESIEEILNDHFVKVGEFLAKKGRKAIIPNHVILAFVSYYDWVIHTVYYSDGVFYSKNGMFPPKEFQKLKELVKKSYWDTKTIRMYRLDEEKVKQKL